MLELFEKVVMTAIGTAAITQKKAEELASEIRDRYKLSEEEGKQFMDRLQALAKDSKEKVREMSEAEVQKVIERMGLVPREEFDRLVQRVQMLEAKVNATPPCSLS